MTLTERVRNSIPPQPNLRRVSLRTKLVASVLILVFAALALISLASTFALNRYLMLNANRVLSKAQILDHVWKYDFRGDDNIVESYISYLRRKVDNVQPRLIHTLRGVGYVLRKPAV